MILTPGHDYKAYARTDRDDSAPIRRVVAGLGTLLNLAAEIESPLLGDLKHTIALALKWRFDFLAKRLESPFALERDVDYWIDLFRMFKSLGEQRWFD